MDMSQEIYFVTGKGGVGKSVVAAALAKKLADQKKKVLLVELGDQSFYQLFFQVPKLGYQPVNVKNTFDVALWTGAACLQEYARYLLKLESIYKIFFENKVTQSLINIAPGLKELATLGKITSGIRSHGPPLPYDCIVVDAFATGHFLAFLRAPLAMSEAVRIGPMHDQSKSIDQVLHDSKVCHFSIVTLPEELPVQEAEELHERLKKELKISTEIILNKFLETPLTEKDIHELQRKKQSEFVEFLGKILKRQSEMYTRLKELNSSIKIAPLVLKNDPWGMVETLAKKI